MPLGVAWSLVLVALGMLFAAAAWRVLRANRLAQAVRRPLPNRYRSPVKGVAIASRKFPVPPGTDRAEWEQRMSSLRHAVRQPIPPVAIVDGPLPGGADALQFFGAGEPLDAYVAIAADRLNDVSLQRAYHRAVFYQLRKMQGKLPHASLTVSWFADRYEDRYGDGTFREGSVEPVALDRKRIARRVLKRVRKAPFVELPGVGRARVVYLD